MSSHGRCFALVALSALACGGRAVKNDSGGGTAGTGPIPVSDCIVGLRIDWCCDQPVLVRAIELESDPCLVAWSRRNSVPDQQRAMCKARAMGCEKVRCTTPPVPSRLALPAPDGSCAFADECESNLDCDLARDASRFCGCSDAHSIVEIEAEGCLFSETDHTAVDCLIPLCGAAAPCPTCPVCPSSVPARCDTGQMGLLVCGPPFDGFDSF